MTHIKQFFVLIFVMTLAAVHPAQAQDWQLVDADLINDDTYLILTVPQDEPAELANVTAQIEAQFGVLFTAEWPLQSIAVHCLIFDASAVANVEAVIADMQADARIRTAQRMQSFQVSETIYPDSLFPLQWSLDSMNASKAHLFSTGSGVKIGVIDSAIDITHPDLAGQVIDKRDFVTTSPSRPGEAHGTAVAGIIAADATNSAGIVGMAPAASLVGLRACWQAEGEAGKCNSFSLARALNFAILNDIDVINLSVGGPADPLIEELVLTAIDDGMIIVAASGEAETMAFPASVPGVIAAGAAAVGRVPAPMIDVITTAPNSVHRYVSGSSVAAAHVSGVVALMLAQQADLTSDDVKGALMSAVTSDGDVAMLDACKALQAVGDPTKACIR